MNIKKLAAWAAIAIGFMVLLQIAVSYVANNKKFEVVYSSAVDRDGYEDEKAAVRVYASPAIKWDEAGGLGKFLGRLFWLGILVAAWWVGTDRHQPKGSAASNTAKSNRQAIATLILMIPVVLCAICWFASYSSSLDQGSLVIGFEEFVQRFAISDETAQKIITDGGSGVNIKDGNGLLTAYFIGK